MQVRTVMLSLGAAVGLGACYDPPLAIQLDPKEAVHSPVPAASASPAPARASGADR